MKPLLPESRVTPPEIWDNRRTLLKMMGAAMMAGLSPRALSQTGGANGNLIPTPEALATHYNNYYEFSFDKEEPARLAQALKTDPWTLEVDGLVQKPLRLDIPSLIERFPVEERIYRFRCVEAWSAVLPWQGFMLRDLLMAASPLSSAKYVAFTSIMAPEAMPSQKAGKLLAWPYREALRLDEAMHPLTLMATGLYGKPLPNQNGAPIRLVVPWKYGFKSIKAVVRIELVDKEPSTSWNLQAPDEYGFYANVNPDVPHPRWSQASERPLGSGFFQPRLQTLPFNGYAEEVASLYSGMDLKRYY